MELVEALETVCLSDSIWETINFGDGVGCGSTRRHRFAMELAEASEAISLEAICFSTSSRSKLHLQHWLFLKGDLVSKSHQELQTLHRQTSPYWVAGSSIQKWNRIGRSPQELQPASMPKSNRETDWWLWGITLRNFFWIPNRFRQGSPGMSLGSHGCLWGP